MDQDKRYPLAWPVGWKRTPYSARRRAAFHAHKTVYGSLRPDGSRSTYKQKESLSVGQGLERLTAELSRLGAKRIVISSNLRLRLDGVPHAAQAKMLEDPGVAVYFRINQAPRVLACDKWLSAAENMAAIAGHIAAIRAQDRYGVGTLDQAFAGYAALPAAGESQGGDWRAEMDFQPGEPCAFGDVETRYRRLLFERHPDNNAGSHEAMVRLNRARDEARKFLGNFFRNRLRRKFELQPPARSSGRDDGGTKRVLRLSAF